MDVIRRRELKWLQMLDEWDKYMTQKYRKVIDWIKIYMEKNVK